MGQFWLQAAPRALGPWKGPRCSHGCNGVQNIGADPHPSSSLHPSQPHQSPRPLGSGGLMSLLLPTGSSSASASQTQTDNWRQWVQLRWSLLAWGGCVGLEGWGPRWPGQGAPRIAPSHLGDINTLQMRLWPAGGCRGLERNKRPPKIQVVTTSCMSPSHLRCREENKRREEEKRRGEEEKEKRRRGEEKRRREEKRNNQK